VFRKRQREARVGLVGGGIARREIQDRLKPPVRLVADLDGHAAQRSLGARENCEVNLLAGQLVCRDEVELEEIRVRGVEKRCPVSSVQSDRERSHGRSSFEGQSIFLRVMNVAA